MTDDLARTEHEQLRELIGVSALVTSSLDAREIRRRAVEAATRLVDAERASLLLLDGNGERMYFEVALGDDADMLSKVRMVPGQGIAGSVVQTRAPAVVNDVRSDPRYCP
ncbi:MAG: GAF domain-containing protein, partial [Coriobacteriia bacterium]